ncbi:MAG: N-acetyltransferase [Tagaea sp.]|nr:N-acetyltransferase [Tagaea sp.]
MFTVTTERPEDRAAIDHLLDRAFGPDRESKASYAYRKGVAQVADLALVARANADGAILGTLRFWPVRIGSHAALLLGPLAVEPALKGRGIGAALMFQGLDAAAWARHSRVVLVGDLDYYARFGFGPATAMGLVMPHESPHRLLARELAKGAFAGVAGAIARHPGRILRGGGLKAA